MSDIISQEMRAVLARERQEAPGTATRPATAQFAAAMERLRAELEKFGQYRAWWALNDPVAYVFLCRAERRGAIVPWTEA